MDFVVQFHAGISAEAIAGELPQWAGFDLISDILSPSDTEHIGVKGELITKSYPPRTVHSGHTEADRTAVLFRNVRTRVYYVKDYSEYGGKKVFIKWITTVNQPGWLRQLFWNIKEGQWSFIEMFIEAGFQVPRGLLKVSDRRRHVLVFASEHVEHGEAADTLSDTESRECIEHCAEGLHQLADRGIFPAMLRAEEILHVGSGEQVLLADTSVGIWPVFRCLFPLMLGMRDAGVLGRFPVDDVLTDSYFRKASWKKETKALRTFLSSLPQDELVEVLHRAVEAWRRNSLRGEWGTAEMVLSEEEAFLLSSFPGSEAARRLQTGWHVPL